MFGEKNNNNISSLVRQCTVVVYIPCTTGQCFLLFTKQKGMIGVYDIFTRGRGEVPIFCQKKEAIFRHTFTPDF